MDERLQKLIARAGVASRRHAEQLILAGHVTVNGKVVTELGSKADPERDAVKVNGKLLRFPARKIYLALNKPAECVATMSDPEGRKTLRDCLRGAPGNVFPVGRLDYHSEGLVLLMSDGELASRLLKVSKRLPQTFWIKVKGPLNEQEIREVRQAAQARLGPLKGKGMAPNPWYEATFTEVKKDLLRQTLARLGHPVEKMRRVQLGSLVLGNLKAGEYRELSGEEVLELTCTIARSSRSASDADGNDQDGQRATGKWKRDPAGQIAAKTHKRKRSG